MNKYYAFCLAVVLATGLLVACQKQTHYLDGHYPSKDYADRNIKALAPYCGQPDGEGYRPCAAFVTVYTRGQTTSIRPMSSACGRAARWS